jgi:hypothetical protein
MSTRTRLSVAAACLVGGCLLAVLAGDVLRWQSRVHDDDRRFASVPARNDLWSAPQLIPLGVARALLDVDDDLAYRHAVQAFVRGRPGEVPYSDAEIIAQRGEAQGLLTDIADGSRYPERQSAAGNLVGVLSLENAALDPPEALGYLTTAVARFRHAVAVDPDNADAKYNLELAIGRLPAARNAAGTSTPRGSRGGAGAGSGARRAGSGY